VAIVGKYIPWGLATHKKTSLWGGGAAGGYLYKHISGLGSEIFDLVFLESFDLILKMMFLKYFFGGKSVVIQRDRS